MANGRKHVRDALKIDRKTFFNPSGWFDYQSIADLNATIIDIIRSTFFLPKPDPNAKPETFERAMKRQGISEAALAETKKTYKNFSYVFCLLGIIDLLYTFYLLFFHFSILGFLLGISTSLLFFGQAFRFDFWAYQIEKRKLGVTFAEWKRHLLGK